MITSPVFSPGRRLRPSSRASERSSRSRRCCWPELRRNRGKACRCRAPNINEMRRVWGLTPKVTGQSR